MNARPRLVIVTASSDDLVDSFADRVATVARNHFSDVCGCLTCADGRRWLGHAPLTPGLAATMPRTPLAVRVGGRAPHSAEAHWRHGASLLGMPYQEYRQHAEQGERWCTWHRGWHAASVPFSGKTSSICRESGAEYMRQWRRRRAEGTP